jgi:16S rRNA (guanine966-N2)-methyltransferase
VRIIGGTWRSRLLSVLDLPGLRPSTDRIRETLFNWLGQDLTGLKCLDLFAGTGALGFEAASRGASEVVLIERDKKAHANLQTNFSLLHLIFIDPPFQDASLLDRAVLEAGRVCDDAAGGGIYVEFPASRQREEIEALLPSWHCGKYLEAGQVKACLFRGRRG